MSDELRDGGGGTFAGVDGPANVVRVDTLVRYDRKWLTVLIVLAIVVLGGGFIKLANASLAHTSRTTVVIDVTFLAGSLLFLLGYYVRTCVLGARARMEIRADGVLVCHPKAKNADLAWGSRLVPWGDISHVQIAARASVGGLMVSGRETRHFVVLKLADGSEVYTIGVAVRFERDRDQLEPGARALDAARRAATGTRQPESAAERRFRDGLDGYDV